MKTSILADKECYFVDTPAQLCQQKLDRFSQLSKEIQSRLVGMSQNRIKKKRSQGQGRIQDKIPISNLYQRQEVRERDQDDVEKRRAELYATLVEGKGEEEDSEVQAPTRDGGFRAARSKESTARESKQTVSSRYMKRTEQTQFKKTSEVRSKKEVLIKKERKRSQSREGKRTLKLKRERPLSSEREEIKEVKSIQEIHQEFFNMQVTRLNHSLLDLQQKTNQISQNVIGNAYTVQNPKLLDKIFQDFITMLAIHWDEVVELLLQDLFQEEIQVLNSLEYNQRAVKQAKTMKIAARGGTAHAGGDGPFMNYEKLELKEVMSVFDEYLATQKRVEATLELND